MLAGHGMEQMRRGIVLRHRPQPIGFVVDNIISATSFKDKVDETFHKTVGHFKSQAFGGTYKFLWQSQ